LSFPANPPSVPHRTIYYSIAIIVHTLSVCNQRNHRRLCKLSSKYTRLSSFLPHSFDVNIFYRRMLVDIFECDDISTVAPQWNKHFYFSEWNTGFYFTWKSQYFTSIYVINVIYITGPMISLMFNIRKMINKV
jgi:hypothetical protein